MANDFFGNFTQGFTQAFTYGQNRADRRREERRREKLFREQQARQDELLRRQEEQDRRRFQAGLVAQYGSRFEKPEAALQAAASIYSGQAELEDVNAPPTTVRVGPQAPPVPAPPPPVPGLGIVPGLNRPAPSPTQGLGMPARPAVSVSGPNGPGAAAGVPYGGLGTIETTTSTGRVNLAGLRPQLGRTVEEVEEARRLAALQDQRQYAEGQQQQARQLGFLEELMGKQPAHPGVVANAYQAALSGQPLPYGTPGFSDPQGYMTPAGTNIPPTSGLAAVAGLAGETLPQRQERRLQQQAEAGQAHQAATIQRDLAKSRSQFVGKLISELFRSRGKELDVVTRFSLEGGADPQAVTEFVRGNRDALADLDVEALSAWMLNPDPQAPMPAGLTRRPPTGSPTGSPYIQQDMSRAPRPVTEGAAPVPFQPREWSGALPGGPAVMGQAPEAPGTAAGPGLDLPLTRARLAERQANVERLRLNNRQAEAFFRPRLEELHLKLGNARADTALKLARVHQVRTSTETAQDTAAWRKSLEFQKLALSRAKQDFAQRGRGNGATAERYKSLMRRSETLEKELAGLIGDLSATRTPEKRERVFESIQDIHERLEALEGEAEGLLKQPRDPRSQQYRPNGWSPSKRDQRLKAVEDFRRRHRRDPDQREANLLYDAVERGLL